MISRKILYGGLSMRNINILDQWQSLSHLLIQIAKSLSVNWNALQNHFRNKTQMIYKNQ
jgi:hypothetical protein